MNEAQFYQSINDRSRELNLNPLLLLSGIEGLHTFRDVPLNTINYDFLDSLILTILALRIGDKFHELAQDHLSSPNPGVRSAALKELSELSSHEVAASNNAYLQSFYTMMNGKSPVRHYHQKALEVAALEIRKAQVVFGNDSIGLIMLAICKEDTANSFGLASLFRA